MTSYGHGHATLLFLLVALSMLMLSCIVGGNKNNTSTATTTEYIEGTRWAVLVAGSNGYENYRHQADICNAYQILKKGGLKDENIIVFMYDDIAFDPYNPRPGIIINKPNGNDVYAGVPKDYTGHNVTVGNFFGVILGNKSALTGGSGKVVDSGPNDHIFIYYTDHGAPGLLAMPYGEDLYAKDLIEVLEKKHARKTYKSMLLYVEACESGSIFEGLLPSNLNIYAITASNGRESSYAVYCPEFYPPPPPQYDTCLGDLFSVSWLEDSDLHDLRKETLRQQYKVVRRRTGFDYTEIGSHVMQYGNLELSKELLSVYMGTNPANDDYSSSSSIIMSDHEHTSNIPLIPTPSTILNQRDASLLHFWEKYDKAPQGSNEKVEAHKKLLNVLSHISHVDNRVTRIATILFGGKENINVSNVFELVRPSGQPLVEDWDCLKMLMRVYEKQCGSLSWYGKKYTRAFANMCNAGVNAEQMIAASTKACLFTDTTPAHA